MSDMKWIADYQSYHQKNQPYNAWADSEEPEQVAYWEHKWSHFYKHCTKELYISRKHFNPLKHVRFARTVSVSSDSSTSSQESPKSPFEGWGKKKRLLPIRKTRRQSL